MGFGQAPPQPCLGPLQGEQVAQKDLQAPLLEFCYQTSHLAPAGPRGQLLPVNKATVLARTLQLSLLPSSGMSSPLSAAAAAAATGSRGRKKKGKEDMGFHEQQASSVFWLIGPVGKGRKSLLPGSHSAPGSSGATGRLRLRHI